MELTAAQANLLAQVEQWPIAQHGAMEARHRADLDVLEDAGLVARTGINWVITDAGRRRMVAVDGKTRLTVEPWTRQAGSPPRMGGAHDGA